MSGARYAISGRLLSGFAAAIAVLMQSSCVLPVRVAPGASGRVVDAETGKPIAGAWVVVRFEGHYDDVLPDRETLGHREAKTDGSGRFSVDSMVRPGVSAWPMYATEARVVSVLADGYRCAGPQPASRDREARVALRTALDESDRRDSCRPVPARRDEAVEYMAAWRALYPQMQAANEREEDRQLERLLAARSVFGFGENCAGPALDLSISPDGRRVAFVVEAEDAVEVQTVELRGLRTPTPSVVAREAQTPARRLAWSTPSDLVLWEPAPEWHRSVSPSAFAARFERVWSATGPAAPASSVEAPEPGSAKGAPLRLGPEDLDDESDARWLGRSFVLTRAAEPGSGLSVDELHVYRENGESHVVRLPGEPCGEPGRFGRPQYRIAADGRTGLDLRFVHDGCHVVSTDLETGHWSMLDMATSPGVCQADRRVPGNHFATALRGYAQELATLVSDANADPAAAYALRIGPDGSTKLDTRNFSGESVTLAVPRFPITTPLRRIEVSILGGVPNIRDRSALPGLEPL